VSNTKSQADCKVAGFVRNSFVDWSGNISFVVFLGGCNFSCPHCHNRNILGHASNTLPLNSVINEIRGQIGFIDGVVISGGEPTTHPHLRTIIGEIRALGLPVKLDTNGSNFEILRDLVNEKLVDYVAMDIKAPLDRYVELGFARDEKLVASVEQSIKFLQSGIVPHTFRTTPIPELIEKDIQTVKKTAGKSPWSLNDFVPVD